MPLYSMSRAHAAAEVEKLEAKGERVVSVVPDGASILVVTETAKRPHWAPLETRAS